MESIGTVVLAWRLAVAAVAVGGPTVLYLGLWRFLAWLRDDALVDRLAARGVVEAPEPAPADVLAAATVRPDGRRCPDCGTTVGNATQCRRCRHALDDTQPASGDPRPKADDAPDGRR